jgi:uncharacterized membrane protein YhfC
MKRFAWLPVSLRLSARTSVQKSAGGADTSEARRVRSAADRGSGARRSRRALVPLIVLALCLAAGLLALALAVPSAQAATTGDITGTVTDASAVDLANITVNVYASVDDYNNGNWIANTQTNGDGSYDLGSLPAGSYLVEFRDDNAGNYLTQLYNNKATIDTANPVAVTAGATHAGINAVLAPAGHITGTVTDASAVDLANITVNVYASVDDYNNGNQIANTQTNGDGSYDLGSLPAGSYLVEFRDDNAGNYLTQLYNNKATIDTANPVAVTAGATHAGINAVLAPAGHITGTVTDASAVAFANINVVAYASVDDYNNGHSIAWTQTAADGSYDLGGLPTGSYLVQFGASMFADHNYVPQLYNNKATIDTANPVAVTAGATHAGINAVLAPAGHISGTVTKAGGGLANVSVYAYASVADYNNGNWIAWNITNADGSYDVGDLPAGSYLVQFGASMWVNGDLVKGNYVIQFYNNEPTIDLATPVAVTAGATHAGINAVLVPAISGTMRLNSGAAYANTTSVTIDSAVTGATQMRFRDSGGTWSSWESYAASRSWTLPAGDGTKTIEAEYRDAVGHVLGLSDDIFLDTTAPTTTASGTDANWHKTPVTVTLAASDSGGSGMSGGLAKTQYKLDAGAWTTGTKLTVSTNGIHTVSYRSTDAAGNVETAKSFTVRIDTRKPTTKAYAAAVKKGKTVKLAYKVLDAKPGCGQAAVTLKVYEGKKLKKTLKAGTHACNLKQTCSWRCTLAKGKYTLRVYATDIAGNVQSKVGSARLTVK